MTDFPAAALKTKRIRVSWAGGIHWFEIEPKLPETLAKDATAAVARYRQGLDTHKRAPLHDREALVLQRLIANQYGSEDIVETIRCGLIGGGDLDRSDRAAEWAQARDLVLRYVQTRPLIENLPLAQTILLATIYGVDEALAGAGLDAVQIPMSSFMSSLVGADG